MLRFDNIVFGPIHSRRLGSSLGINLLPRHGKLCNFDCIYCECGWNKDGRTDENLPSVQTVVAALEEKLSACMAEGTRIDSITFSGHGEPTLHPDFAEIADATVMLRDRYFPEAVISVLSNATMLDRPGVADALRKVDNPILKLDAPTDELVREINRPNGRYSVEAVIEGLKQFKGDFILQTMFLKGASPDYSIQPDALAAWVDIVRRLRPRKVMVYTLDRPAPAKGLEKMDAAQIRTLLEPLLDEGFDVQINA